MTGSRARRALLIGCLAVAGWAVAAAMGGEAPYPIVTEPPPQFSPPVTNPNGSVVQRPVDPTVYDVAPSPTCERIIATFHDGSKPTRRPIVVPPRPGLYAEALSLRTVRVHWRFAAIPAECRPATLALAIVANGEPNALPWKVTVTFSKSRGSTRLTYPDFAGPPTVALAGATMRDGRPSRTARVLIRR